MKRRSSVCYLILSVSMLMLALSGCSRNSGEAYLENYLSRLSNVTGVVIPEPLPLTSLSFPTPADIHKQAVHDDQAKIGILDFLSLSGCELQSVIGQINSSLGKFAPDSQQLLTELRFLDLAPLCLKRLNKRENEELANKISQAISDKKANLNHNIWKAILASDEAKSFWSTRNISADYPANTSIEVTHAIQSLHQQVISIQSGNYDVDASLLEHNLSLLMTGDGGALFQSLQRYQQAITLANQMLDQLHTLDCKPKGHEVNLNHINNVVEKFFVGEVQVWAAQLSQRFYELISSIQALEAALAKGESVQYLQWRIERDQKFETAIFSSREHVKRLKYLEKICDTKQK